MNFRITTWRHPGIFGILCVAFCVVVFQAQAQEKPASSPLESEVQALPYKIGVLLPLSGKHRKLGEAIMDGLTFAQVAWEPLGKVSFVLADTRGKPEVAKRALERLARDPSVALVLGPVGWKSSRAAAVLAQDLKIPLLSLSAEEGIEALGQFVFRVRPSPEEQARHMARVAVEELRIERFAILHPDNELGQRSAEVFFEEVRRAGGRVMAMSSYKANETNMMKGVEELVGKRAPRVVRGSLRKPPQSSRRQTDKAGNLNFDAIFVPDYDDFVALSTRFLRFHDVELSGWGDGSSVQILGTSHMPGPRLSEAEGMLAGALYPEIFHPERAGDSSAAYTAAFEEAYDRPPSDLDAQLYDLYGRVLTVLVEEKALSGQEVRGRLPELLIQQDAYTGLIGLQWFEPDGRPGYQFEVWAVDGDGLVSPSF